MDTYRFGDWVEFDPGYKDPEIGRVTIDKGDSAFVCYHTGCTAASTSKKHLRRATMEEILAAPRGIGYHRFDAECPNADGCPTRDLCESLRLVNNESEKETVGDAHGNRSADQGASEIRR